MLSESVLLSFFSTIYVVHTHINIKIFLREEIKPCVMSLFEAEKKAISLDRSDLCISLLMQIFFLWFNSSLTL